MRIWTLHPSYLDTKGLVALWREALLAQKVLLGKTRGYKNHPQLERFKSTENPIKAVGCYLSFLCEFAKSSRNYNFNKDLIIDVSLACPKINTNKGQLEYEFEHLQNKLYTRSKDQFFANVGCVEVKEHTLFSITNGPVENWERL